MLKSCRKLIYNIMPRLKEESYISLKKNADGGGNGSPSLLGEMRKRNSHWERLGLPLSLRLGKWNFYNNLVLSNAGDPYITENITHNSHQNTHIVNQNIDRKNIRRINETFSMLYDITTLQSIGLNCMVKQAGSTLKSSSFSEIQETEKEYTSSYHSKGKGDDKIYQASLNYNWKSKNGKHTLRTVLDYLRSDETKELNHHYLYQYPEKNEEDNKCSNTGTVSDLWKAEINYIFLLNKHSRLKWGGDYYNNHTGNQMYYAYQSEEGWQKEDKSGLFTYKGIGYAGYAEYGSDIVCAGVSTLAINCINSIEEFTDTKFDLVQNDNDGLLDFTCKEPLDSGAVLLLKSLFKGIQGIQESYGKQYVTFH